MYEWVRSEDDLARLVDSWGFLPLLQNRIRGFSVQEHTPPELWFADGVDGPWEWKGPVIRKTGCAYGKFFGGKAGFISREWFTDFANYRRDGYDFDARYDDGLARSRDKYVFDILWSSPPLLSSEWRQMTGIKKRGEFDAIVNRLQMTGYVVTVDFEYSTDRAGKRYGWGLSRYTTPEYAFGGEFSSRVYRHTPQQSRRLLRDRLQALLPAAGERQLDWVLG